MDHEEVHRHHACADVEQLIGTELNGSTPGNQLGEGDTVKQKEFDIVDEEKKKILRQDFQVRHRSHKKVLSVTLRVSYGSGEKETATNG